MSQSRPPTHWVLFVVVFAALVVAAVGLPVRQLDDQQTTADTETAPDQFATTTAPSPKAPHNALKNAGNERQSDKSRRTVAPTVVSSSAPNSASQPDAQAPTDASTTTVVSTKSSGVADLVTSAVPTTSSETIPDNNGTSSTTSPPEMTKTSATSSVPAGNAMPGAPPLQTGGGPRKPSWKDHPVYKADPNSVKPPILAWFTTRNSEEAPRSLRATGVYVQQSSEFTLLGTKYKGKPESKQLQNFDTLVIGTWGPRELDNFLEFETTRDSQMCLTFSVNDPRFKGNDAEMSVPPGYRALGLAQAPENSTAWPEIHKFASYQGKPMKRAYVACRTLPAGVHQLPSKEKMEVGYKLWSYNLLFSEVDGSVPPLPVNPPGWTGPEIVAHRNCPKELHDMWRVENHDSADSLTSGMTWQTWHPQRDYLYNCYYGHEHGSPGMLVGYTERFHYTAFKNNDQKETHEGFKGYVVPVGDYNMYLNIHSNTKFMGRMNTQNHTMVIAILDRSGKLEFEMSCKCNFGGSAADYSKANYPKQGTPVFPMGDAESQKLILDMYAVKKYTDRKIMKKRMNLYNPPNLNPKLRYEKGDAGRGIYEAWIGGGDQYCMKAAKPYQNNGIEVDIKNSHTGCRDQACETKIVLGKAPDKNFDYFRPNLGTHRALRFRNLSIAPQHCGFKLNTDSGVFYTDQYCGGVLSGPGPNAVKQFMHPAFKGVSLHGIFDISDVHGHHMYEVSQPRGPDDSTEATLVKGLFGFSQDQGALSYSVLEPTY